MVEAKNLTRGSLDDAVQQVNALKGVNNFNPYCVATYGMKSYRSRTVLDSTSPKWDETAKMWVTHLSKDYKLEIRIYDQREENMVRDAVKEATKRMDGLLEEIKCAAGGEAGDETDEAVDGDPLLGRLVLDVSKLIDHRSEGEVDVWLALAQTDEELTDKDQSALLNEERGKVGEDLTISGLPEQTSVMAVKLRLKYTRKAKAEADFFQHLLERFDTEGSGRLGKVQICAALDSMGVAVSNEDVNRIFEQCDSDQSDLLELAELHRLLSSSQFQNDPMAFSLLSYCMDGPDGMHRMVTGIFDSLTHESMSQDQDAADIAAGVLPTKNTLLKIVDRRSGLILDEHIPTYIKMALNSMYRTSLGTSLVTTDSVKEMLLRMSQTEGAKMDDPESKAKIPHFVAQHCINTDELLLPLEEYNTFNEFFYRRLKAGARPCADPDNPNVAVSPADCRMVVFPMVTDATNLWVKGSNFTMANLLGPRQDLVDVFDGGSLVIARLAPQDYHRWHVPVTGVMGRVTRVDGTLYTVNPIAVRKPIDVFTENVRYLCEIESREFGKVLLIAVGATMVGSVNVLPYATEGKLLEKGMEHGYFAFGGSTTLLLFQKDSIVFDYDLLENSQRPVENLMQVGMRIGIAADAYEADRASREAQALAM